MAINTERVAEVLDASAAGAAPRIGNRAACSRLADTFCFVPDPAAYLCRMTGRLVPGFGLAKENDVPELR